MSKCLNVVSRVAGGVTVRRLAVQLSYGLVRYAPMIMLALMLMAVPAFAQTEGSTEPEEFEAFPEFFNFQSLVTQGITFIGGGALLIYGAIVAWRITLRLFNTFVRRVG